MEQHRDEHIVCAMCGTSFLFSAAEAAVYAERGLAPPKRCRECRRARKEQRGRRDEGPRGGQGRAADAGARVPRYTGDVNEYRSPMPDAYTGAAWSAPPRHDGGAAGPRHRRGGRVSQDDGIYRAPSFGGEGAARTAPLRLKPHRRGSAPDAQRQGRASPEGASPEGASPEARPPRNRPMFSITCKSCGSVGEVPFKPIEGRDVFCQPCYRARKSA